MRGQTNQSKRDNNKCYKEKNPHARRGNKKRNENTRSREVEEVLDSTQRDNNPNWYFTDAGLADQVSRLAMRNFAGQDINAGDFAMKCPTINTVYVNPCPGVQTSYIDGGQKSAVNLAGFRLYTKVGALTGRNLPYLPKDMSTAVLAFGEVISMVEFLRRAFGVAYTYSQRNRSYPIKAIKAMGINAEDLIMNFSKYRNRFNMLITRINQLPIPKDVAYFDKCASLYEKIYLDSPSAMASSIMLVPATTWTIDEAGYEGGTVLRTTPVTYGDNSVTDLSDAGTVNQALVQGLRQFHDISWYFNVVELMVDRLLGSQTLNLVYADLINYAAKMGKSFWVFDYLRDDYSVFPEYNANFLLQFHNATFVGMPQAQFLVNSSPDQVVTPLNDVYPNPDNNTLYYNPAFRTNTRSNTLAPAVRNILVDFTSDNPSVEDRIEALRFTSLLKGFTANGIIHKGGSAVDYYTNVMLVDHYFVGMTAWTNDEVPSISALNPYATIDSNFDQASAPAMASLTAMDWAPFMYNLSAGAIIGDRNFYTTVDEAYLRPIIDFVGLALYDLR
jgi:hypothetical protein